MTSTVARLRLQNQCLTRSGGQRVAEMVAWLGAVQAQEYAPSKWGLGQRLGNGVTDADIEAAFDEGLILRTHVMRPTWHYVTPADIRWMLALTAPRVQRTMATYVRHSGLDAADLRRGTTLVERALASGRSLTRAELGARLARAGLPAKGFSLALLAMHAELEGVICSGPRRGNEHTYSLLATRAPRARLLPRDEALAELTRRYFSSHGPATIRDFVWWSGLTTPDARRGLEINRAREETIDGRTYWTLAAAPTGPARRRPLHLLPIYDEYVIAYRDRQAIPHGPIRIQSASRGPVTFQHALVIRGHVAGTWKIARTARGASVDVYPLKRLTEPEKRELNAAAARYGRFLDLPVSVTVG